MDYSGSGDGRDHINPVYKRCILPIGRLYVPGSKLHILGMVIPPFIQNPYNRYINAYYWVEDPALLYGNNGSWSTLAHRSYLPPFSRIWKHLLVIGILKFHEPLRLVLEQVQREPQEGDKRNNSPEINGRKYMNIWGYNPIYRVELGRTIYSWWGRPTLQRVNPLHTSRHALLHPKTNGTTQAEK